jgi:hypothetical protein
MKQEYTLSLTNKRNEDQFRADRKQNNTHRFQIINLLFLSRNSATFDAKVTEFLGTNK